MYSLLYLLSCIAGFAGFVSITNGDYMATLYLGIISILYLIVAAILEIYYISSQKKGDF